MPYSLLVALVIGAVVIAVAVRCVLSARQAGPAQRILTAVIAVSVGLFCLFGFLAAREPGDYRIVWQIVYGLAFLVCMAATVFVFLARQSNSDAEHD